MDYLVNTPCGAVQGTQGRLPGTAAYKGIRYATAERWEYPSVVTHWEGVYDATRYGACSYQPRAFYDESQTTEKAFYYNEFRKGEIYAYSDDCLFLNIWTPEDARPESRLPVLFYIHGGGFTGGCGHEKHFDGPVWPKKGVIGVTINYRLGPMGFLCLPELKEEAGHTGNYALYDMLAALTWVRSNIASFGGDPERITIMGQSAGAMSVQLLCQSPLSAGMFAGAVMSSGGGLGTKSLAKSPEKACAFWQEVMTRCGCKTVAELRALPAEKLFSVWTAARKEVKGGAMAAMPCNDGIFVTGAAPHDIPYLIGLNSEDIMPPILFSVAKKWCRTQASQGKKPGYCWFFDRQLPGDGKGAWHSSDLWYWFGTLANCWRPLTDKDTALSDQMTDYLTNFAKTGNPNGSGLPIWESTHTGQKLVLRLGEAPTAMGTVSSAKLVKTMLTTKAVGE